MPAEAHPMADLEHILQQLHDSEINAGVQTFDDAGMRVWIGDEMNGIQAETTMNRTRCPPQVAGRALRCKALCSKLAA
jgi:hypothetical protein